MILKGFKEKSNKNYINSQLKMRVVSQSNTKTKRIGVIFNAEELTNVPIFNALAEELNTKKENIEIIAFKPQVKKEEKAYSPTYTLKHLGWKGTIKEAALKQFLNTEFDLLISYYKKETTPLKLLTVASKSKFKVGILETDERINDLIIKTEINDFKTFTSELKKYLNILNKI
ncbi:hypothetical protein [Lacinutrix sp. Bg11-31]|uniref:DUF6913 domain-containing protein n=1 Tax=Lacinutrix sp. Bg11-31 TaxID=2057808 RepID=UPI000C301C39|nr:hypothetical protein [Lacinutrix sp. Bg11-31]AUC81919.1 hypothetical protein CW733_07160 [Lacinutrix sp. Bg11-31]